MHIKITGGKKISEVQKEFSEVFPFLKLEFFQRPHKKGAGSLKKQLFSNDQSLEKISGKKIKGDIVVTPEMKVGDLEQAFYDKFGLSVQVFRKSGKSWLETTATDEWTLAKQNYQGELLSGYLKEKKDTDRAAE